MGGRRVTLILGSSRGVLFLPGVSDTVPHVVGRKDLMEDTGHTSSIHGVGDEQLSPHGWGSWTGSQDPFRGQSTLPSQSSGAGHLAFFFFCQPPFRGQSCPVVSPGHSKDWWAAGLGAVTRKESLICISFSSYYRAAG